MKIRSGFVSNSSSSSFVLLKRDTSLTKDELLAKSLKPFKEAYGFEDGDEEEAEGFYGYSDSVMKYAENNSYIVMLKSVDWNTEISEVEEIMYEAFDALGVDHSNISLDQLPL